MGATLAEAQKINLSLLELGNVISALSEADGCRPSSASPFKIPCKVFVPFRNSTLTRLLQESLGGNCKTSLLLCVSPAVADASETRGTLQFGSRAMRVKQDAVINARANYEEVAEKLARQLQDKEAVWQRKHAALESRFREALAALAARDEEIRELKRRLGAASEAEQRVDEANQRACDAERRVAEVERCMAADREAAAAAMVARSAPVEAGRRTRRTARSGHTARDAGDDEELCHICHTALASGHVTLDRCGHSFHTRCVAEWLGRGHSSCPVCRTDVDDEQRRHLCELRGGSTAARNSRVPAPEASSRWARPRTPASTAERSARSADGHSASVAREAAVARGFVVVAAAGVASLESVAVGVPVSTASGAQAAEEAPAEEHPSSVAVEEAAEATAEATVEAMEEATAEATTEATEEATAEAAAAAAADNQRAAADASIAIRAAWRGSLGRWLALALQLKMLSRRGDAAGALQAAARGLTAHRHFQTCRAASVRLQASVRRRAAARATRRRREKMAEEAEAAEAAKVEAIKVKAEAAAAKAAAAEAAAVEAAAKTAAAVATAVHTSRVDLDSLRATLAELEAALEGERRERADERSSAQASAAAAAQDHASVLAQLVKLKSSSGAMATASRLATASLALGDDFAAAGTPSPSFSPSHNAERVAAAWLAASGDGERHAVSTVGCQVSDLASVPSLEAKPRQGARRRWSLLCCGAARVEPWSE